MDHQKNQRGNQKIPRNKWKWKQDDPKPMGCRKSSPKRVYSNTRLPQETRKISKKKSNLTPKETRERKTKPKVSRRKEIIKIRAEINEIETKRQQKQKRSMKLKPGSLKI